MSWNILKISLILSVIATSLAARQPQVTTKIIEGHYDEIRTYPFIGLNNKLYYFGQKKVNWHQATLECRSLGGFLASINSRFEFATLSNFLKSRYPLDRWWLSGSDLHSEGNFAWYSTGKRFEYTDWMPGQPNNGGGNEHCVHLLYEDHAKKYKLNDWNCNQMSNYICETENPKTVAEFRGVALYTITS